MSRVIFILFEEIIMKQTLVTLTIAHSRHSDITPLLLEYLSEEQIFHVSLLDGLSATEISEKYGARDDEATVTVHLTDNRQMALSLDKVEQGLQQLICQLESRGAENILLLSAGPFPHLQADSAVLLEPDRLVPPLIKAMVDGHQVGILVSNEQPLRQQAHKWRNLSQPACFAVASLDHDNEKLLDAGLMLQEQGADVVVLDSPGYHHQHRDFLQNLLGIPVLLSNLLLAKMAAELLA
jgi:protein AroM